MTFAHTNFISQGLDLSSPQRGSDESGPYSIRHSGRGTALALAAMSIYNTSRNLNAQEG
jgi:hypothetical protein